MCLNVVNRTEARSRTNESVVFVLLTVLSTNKVGGRFKVKYRKKAEEEGDRGNRRDRERERGRRDGEKRKRTSCLLLMGSSSARLVCSLVA